MVVKRHKRKFTADFETTTDENDCRVWAYAISEIGNVEHFEYGNSIEGFLDWCYKNAGCEIFFHNLKFDGQFIIDYLLKSGFDWIENPSDRDTGTFTTLITDMGQFYSLTIYFRVSPNRKQVKRVVIKDSLKILNFSVDKIAKDFQLPIRKLELDYDTKREVGHQLTKHEIDYIRNDVEIMSRALNIVFEQGLNKITIGADALSSFKDMKKDFYHDFPNLPLEIDDRIRHSYKGGFTWLNPKYARKEIDEGVVFDKNSMYPSVMVKDLIPVDLPVEFSGRYEKDLTMPLYIQFISCNFELKKDKIPSIQIKNSRWFRNNEYLTTSNNKLVTLALCNPDLELFFSQYNVYDIEWQGGYKFYAKKHIFDDYINHWTEQKIQAKKDGNSSLYLIAKLMLNSLYGKLATGRRSQLKFPYLEDNIVKYGLTEVTEKKGVYLPAGSFITAYARKDIILSSQKIRDWSMKKYNQDLHVYCDTDSIHIAKDLTAEDLEELSEFLDIDDYRLGAWKLESRFTRAKYIRQKCYIHEEDGKIVSTIAGFPKSLTPLVNFDNFDIGFSVDDMNPEAIIKSALENGADPKDIEKMKPKLSYKKVAGGVILQPTVFRIN